MKKYIKEVFVDSLPDAGCDNGNYPAFTAVDTAGREITGQTCRCRKGCSGTTAILTDRNGRQYLYDGPVSGRQA